MSESPETIPDATVVMELNLFDATRFSITISLVEDRHIQASSKTPVAQGRIVCLGLSVREIAGPSEV
jgi:hypothetical protein